jgi:hypothetical protein
MEAHPRRSAREMRNKCSLSVVCADSTRDSSNHCAESAANRKPAGGAAPKHMSAQPLRGIFADDSSGMELNQSKPWLHFVLARKLLSLWEKSKRNACSRVAVQYGARKQEQEIENCVKRYDIRFDELHSGLETGGCEPILAARRFT